jgi:hypothetical protein
MKLFLFLILAVFASDKQENDTTNDQNYRENDTENSIFVKIEEDEYDKVNKKSQYIGVCYHKNISKWRVQRWSSKENKKVCNGCYDDQETAAHASDTLARKLMEIGEKQLTLNFPDDDTEVYPDKKSTTSKFIGVTFQKNNSKWYVQRWSQNDNKKVSNGCYNEAETAAHASDTLARQLMENGEQKLTLNFPDDYIEVYREKKTSKYIGVSYNNNKLKWNVQRWSKNENKMVYNGTYGDEETAAHASDTLARKLMKNGEQEHKLNFTDNYTKVYSKEKESSSKFIGVSRQNHNSKWQVQR